MCILEKLSYTCISKRVYTLGRGGISDNSTKQHFAQLKWKRNFCIHVNTNMDVVVDAIEIQHQTPGLRDWNDYHKRKETDLIG